MSSVPSFTPSYSTDRPQVVGRIGQHGGHAPADELAPVNPADKVDTVEISGEALAAASNPDTPRALRLAQIKAQIQAGTYGEDAKLTFAADRIARLLGNG
ncbi:MAG: flagellar biosynthesis anti-sigma factor FlgM [Phycisphaerales bacterium]|nr:flagellar biosynthesis anti-sigma factor FlgM [Phycisphaerales bacterium]